MPFLLVIVFYFFLFQLLKMFFFAIRVFVFLLASFYHNNPGRDAHTCWLFATRERLYYEPPQPAASINYSWGISAVLPPVRC